jgi:uncharacterized membrane-anchored protein YitT (DUF2179 family)
LKNKLKDILVDYFFINLGLLISAIGIGLFLVPGKIVSGGVSGIATITYYLFNLPVGMVMLALNIPLFLIGLKIFGKTYGVKTFFGTVFLSVYIDLLRYFIPNANNIIDFEKGSNALIAPIFGGVITGIGIGIIMKFGGSTGGTDIVAQIINKYFKIPLGYSFIFIDGIILLVGSSIFGLEKGLYAIISLYASAIAINKIFEGVSYSKMVYIISDYHEDIRNLILHDFDRGGTGLYGNGLYTNKDKKIIMTVLKNKEIHDLKNYVKQIDPNAFVIISEVYEVLGEGFTPF